MNAIRLCLWMNCSMLCLELTGPTGRRGRGLSPPPLAAAAQPRG